MHSATRGPETANPPAADRPTDPPRENVQAVTRALELLDSFRPDELGVTLTDLANRLAMRKSTVLRTARTLARSGYLAQLPDGRWRLGPAAGWLGVRYQTAFDVSNAIDTVLRRLADATGETAAFFVRENDSRTCVARVDRPSLEREHIRVGEKLPLARGASGQVLLAFSGVREAGFDAVRRQGYYVSVAERDSAMSSIAVPVFAGRQRLYGAVCVSGLAARLGREALERHLPALIRASEQLSARLAEGRVGTPTGSGAAGEDRFAGARPE